MYAVTDGVLAQMPWNKLTHIIWQDVQVNSATDPGLHVQENYPWSQISSVVTAAHSHGVKALISLVGPWNSTDLGSIVQSTTLRAALIKNLTNMVTTYNADGIEIDWEALPDPNLYAQFVAELDASLRPLGKTIAVVGQWNGTTVPPSVVNNVDFINVMCYDYGTYPYSGSYDMVVNTMNLWASKGFPKNKLVMGLPFFASDLWDHIWIPYRQIVDEFNPLDSQNEIILSTYKGVPVTGGKLAWSGPDLIKQKVNYARTNGFGGVFNYELGTDKLNNSKSLLAAINSQLP